MNGWRTLYLPAAQARDAFARLKVHDIVERTLVERRVWRSARVLRRIAAKRERS